MRKVLKIMIVDDDLMIIRFLKEILDGDYQLQVAHSGEEALGVFDAFCPDIILLDVMMPGIDGYETCRQIRKRKCPEDVKVLFLSAKTTLEERLKGYNSGGDDYITKPFEIAELLAKIEVFSNLWHDEGSEHDQVEQKKDDKQLGIIYTIQRAQADILYIQSKSPYCEIITEPASPPMDRERIPIQVLEDFFKDKKLIRVHRSYLVNQAKIIALRKQVNNEFKIQLRNRHDRLITLPIGRTYHERLRSAMPGLFVSAN